MEHYISVIRDKYAEFDGRAQREEFWYFVLFNIIVSIIVGIIGGIFGASNMLQNLYSLAVLIPSIAVSARRLHDIGKSGWMMLIGLIPVLGWIWIIVLFVTDSESDKNEYGANPKEKKTK